MNRFLPLLALLTLFWIGCAKDHTPVFEGTAEPADFQLSFQQPQEFTFDLAADGAYRLELELTYDPMGVGNWKDIPALFVLIKSDNSDMSHKFQVKVHDGKDWLGTAPEGARDRTVKADMISSLDLKKGKHILRLFGDTNDQNPIYGMVKLVVRVIPA